MLYLNKKSLSISQAIFSLLNNPRVFFQFKLLVTKLIYTYTIYIDISFYSFFSRVQTQEEDTGRTGKPDESPGVSSTFNYDIESGGSVGLVL